MGYFYVVAIVIMCQSYTIKASSLSTTNIVSENVYVQKVLVAKVSTNEILIIPEKTHINLYNYIGSVLENDSIDFEVEVIKPRKFLLSFYKKQASDIFIKIYDVLGNLVHQEKVSKRGKFKKEYDLSAYRNELYVIEIGDSTSKKTRRLFIG
jgi:hypothetical protein